MDIYELIKAVSQSPLTTFELESANDGIKVVMKKENAVNALPVVTQMPIEQPKIINAIAGEAINKSEIKQDNKETVNDGQYITSPMVGTFYASKSPDKPAFVKVGDKVKKGQVVCIVEAMKLMNEIESTVDGEIVEVLVENEDMVEYGQKLFVIK